MFWFYFIYFIECNVGYYGNNCDKKCKCNNVLCDVVIGVCDCLVGVRFLSCIDSKIFIDFICSNIIWKLSKRNYLVIFLVV